MTSPFQIHRGQFILALPGEVAAPSNFEQITLGRFTLHHSPALSVQRVLDVAGHPWVLLGHALETLGTLTPVEQVRQAATADVSGLSASWAGRWVLIGDDRLHTDASGMFGVYYDGVRVSSSPSLLRPNGHLVAHLNHSDSVNWFPPPSSGFVGVQHLLASQVLNLSKGAPEHRSLLVPLPEMTYEAVLDQLQTLLLQAVRQVWGKRNLLPLTAGYDSRLLLAAAAHLNLPLTTFTQEHPSSISKADRQLPPRLAQIAGYQHQYIRRPLRRGVHLAALYDAQAAGHVREQDRNFLAHGQFGFLQEGDLLIRGTGFELGRAYYWDSLPENMSLEALNNAKRTDVPRRAALRAWLEWVAAHPEKMDWRDRMYWEQRIGGWVAASELALDLLPADRFAPSNSQLFLSLLLRVPPEYRRTSQHHVDLIQRLKPELLEVPFNPPETRWAPRRMYAALYRRLPHGVKQLLSG